MQSATPPLHLPVGPRPLEVDFLGGRLTSDGGLPWLAAADTDLGLTASLAAQVPDWRTRCGRHTLPDLVAQRVYQIACGHEDQNDATTLRHDPLLKQCCGRLPVSGPDLASQPTLSRLDNAMNARTCYRLAQAMGEMYLREREREGIPSRILLDLDGTDDPTHGEQEGSAYHGYHQQHQYFPLLVFDGDTHHLIAAVLRPGTVHAGHGALAILKRIVAAIRTRWPAVSIAIRGDSGFALPALYAWCEAAGITYTIGIGRNPRLAQAVAPLLAAAEAQSRDLGGAKVRLLGETTCQADRWPVPRRIVMKAEILGKGPSTRFVVTNRDAAPAAVYDGYVARGACENWIEDLKLDCFAGRLSCCRFWANQARLLLHAAASWLLDTVRRWLVAAGVPPMTLGTLRLRLVKIGGWVREEATRVRLRLASSHPGEGWWRLLAARHHPS